MTAAIYLRLSSEDADLKNTSKTESESISNQRNLLRTFLRERDEFRDADVLEFCDDGYSGKNFERPGFISMMDEIRNGRIQCVLVKDLSRFGRDYLVVGNYISRVFPFLGVRFIAVNDGFDSSRPQDIDSLDTSFKTLIYDLYSRELSRKVRSAKRQRAEKGLFISPFAPYGFVKDPEDKNRLLPDPEAAETVRRIFQLVADGTPPIRIAAMLNREGVRSPMLYKREAGCSRDRWPSIHEDNFWIPATITNMVCDERYIGSNIFGKRERDLIGNVHTVKKDRTDWIVAENMHESIVSRELFAAAQAKMKRIGEKPPANSGRNLLRRKVKCGTCGFSMSLHNGNKPKYFCPTAKLETEYRCSAEGVLQTDVNDAVVTLIRCYAQYAVDWQKLMELDRQRHKDDGRQRIRQLAVLQGQKNQCEKRLQDIYEHLAEGLIGKDEYLSQKAGITEQMQTIDAQIRAAELNRRESDSNGSAFIEAYKAYTELETLTAEIADELVERVILYPDCRMEIILHGRNEFALLMQQYEPAPGLL